MAEGILERIIQHRSTNAEEGLHGRPVPAHLLFLVHALDHDLIDRPPNERSRDRLAMSTPGSIVHQHVLVALEVAEKFADVAATVDAGDLAAATPARMRPPRPPGPLRAKAKRCGVPAASITLPAITSKWRSSWWCRLRT
jgi:hypothetical protein